MKRIKRLPALLLSLCLVLTLAPAARAADIPEGYTAVSTAQELAAIAQDPAGSYILTADIDLGGTDWTPLSFSGVLDGNGHTLYNLRVRTVGTETAETVDGNDKRYDTAFAGLFSVLRGAEVRDLTLLGADIAVETDQNCFSAGLAGYMEDSTLTGCRVYGRIFLYTSSVMVGTGGLAGFGSGTLRDCGADVTLVFADRSTGIRCEQFMGGLLACGNAVLDGCSSRLDGYDSCHGYVHDGGLVGMFYCYDKTAERGSITNCASSGMITFFEDNPDRRAYCSAFVGEPLTAPGGMTGNTDAFTRNEVFDYSAELSPEKCASPVYTEAVTEADCTRSAAGDDYAGWGYTAHTCSGCGYTWRDTYTAPVHEPGEWQITREATYTDSGERARYCTRCGALLETETIAPHVAGDWQTVREPTYTEPGLRERYCTDCGELLESEELPTLIPVSVCTLSAAALTLRYRDRSVLTAAVEPGDAYDTAVVWSSSDESVVTVDQTGALAAVGRGTAVVTCASADGFASASCAVTVRYAVWQWLIVILLFGWLWY